jgi:hypothetical protein
MSAGAIAGPTFLGVRRDASAADGFERVWAAGLAPRDRGGYHAAVLDAYRQGGFLPIRVRAHAGDRLAVDRLIDRHHDRIAAAMRHLSGKVEIVARIAPIAVPDAADAFSGRAYLAAQAGVDALRCKRLAAAEALALAIVQAAAPCAARRRDGVPVLVSVLSERRTAPALGARLLALSAGIEGVECRLVGPLPPYSFAPELG